MIIQPLPKYAWWEPFIPQIAALAVMEDKDLRNDDDFMDCLAIFTGIAQLN